MKRIIIVLLAFWFAPGLMATDAVDTLYAMLAGRGNTTAEEEAGIFEMTTEFNVRLMKLPEFASRDTPVFDYINSHRELFMPKSGKLSHVNRSEEVRFRRMSDGKARGIRVVVYFPADQHAWRSVFFEIRENSGKIDPSGIRIGGFEGRLLLEILEEEIRETEGAGHGR